MDHDGMDMMMMDAETTPECYATDDAFLQTLAWCMSTHCKDVPVWSLEEYWKMNVAGRMEVQPDPKDTYQETLAKMKVAPTETLVNGNPLNKTSLISEDDYLSNLNSLAGFEDSEIKHERYG
jgi:hypothetical protein